MADGGVSIAVRSVYPRKQACILLSDVLQEAENTAGKVVRRLTGPTAPGVQRVTWDLRYPAPNLAPPPNPDGDDTFGPPPGGPLVMPGTYKVAVAKRVNGVVTPFGQQQEFQVVVEVRTR